MGQYVEGIMYHKTAASLYSKLYIIILHACVLWTCEYWVVGYIHMVSMNFINLIVFCLQINQDSQSMKQSVSVILLSVKLNCKSILQHTNPSLQHSHWLNQRQTPHCLSRLWKDQALCLIRQRTMRKLKDILMKLWSSWIQ